MSATPSPSPFLPIPSSCLCTIPALAGRRARAPMALSGMAIPSIATPERALTAPLHPPPRVGIVDRLTPVAVSTSEPLPARCRVTRERLQWDASNGSEVGIGPIATIRPGSARSIETIGGGMQVERITGPVAEQAEIVLLAMEAMTRRDGMGTDSGSAWGTSRWEANTYHDTQARTERSPQDH